MADSEWGGFHRRVDRRAQGALFAVLTTVAILVGGMVEIIPMFTTAGGPAVAAGGDALHRRSKWRAGTSTSARAAIPATRRWCGRCVPKLLRYGEWTRSGEYAYDHPFLLGSRRIGPDLQRVGGKYPDAWHYEHMRNPRSTIPGSIMPVYPWLHTRPYDPADIQASLTGAEQGRGALLRRADRQAPAPRCRPRPRSIVDRLAGAEDHRRARPRDHRADRLPAAAGQGRPGRHRRRTGRRGRPR